MKNFSDYGIDVPSHAVGEIDTTCPQCSADRKKRTARCLSVNADLGTFFCHHCGWSGGLQTDNVVKLHQRLYTKPKAKPKTDLTPVALSWFHKRGITDAVIVRNKIGCDMVFMPQVDGEVSAVQFPYYRGDELINIKHRDHKKNFRMEKGSERILYGLNDVGTQTIIVEGEMDKLSAEVAGYVNCVSVPDGAPTPETKNYASKFEFLNSDKDIIQSVQEWVLAVDNDAAGKRLEDELSRRLGREKCKRVEWPEGCKDANDVLLKLGPDAVRKCIEEAKPYPINGTFTTLDLSGKIDNLYEHGWEKGVSTGWPSLDKFYTVRPGEFTVVTGIPNSGKSNWLDALTVNLADMHGWNIAMFSPENQPLEDHMSRVIEKWCGMPFAQGSTERLDRNGLEIGKQWAGDHFTWILPDDDQEWTIGAVLDVARQLVFRKGIRGLVIDPWNEMEHLRPAGVSETEYVSGALKKIRNFGRRYGVHVWLVAHPSKLYRDKDGQYPVPTMYDISGSAHFRNKADNGICAWRDLADEHSQVVEIHTQKIRFRQIGKIGTAELAYNHVIGTYHELSKAAAEIPASYYRD